MTRERTLLVVVRREAKARGTVASFRRALTVEKQKNAQTVKVRCRNKYNFQCIDMFQYIETPTH